MWGESREFARESGSLGAEVGERWKAHDSVGAHSEDVVPARVQIGRLDELDGKIVGEPLPQRPLTNPGVEATARVALIPVQVIPHGVQSCHPVEAREKQVPEERKSEKTQHLKEQTDKH